MFGSKLEELVRVVFTKTQIAGEAREGVGCGTIEGAARTQLDVRRDTL